MSNGKIFDNMIASYMSIKTSFTNNGVRQIVILNIPERVNIYGQEFEARFYNTAYGMGTAHIYKPLQPDKHQ